MGELEIRVGPEDRTPRGRLPRAVFSILVARLGRALSTDALIEEVWDGSPPKSAPSSLRVHISRIRTAIDVPGLLVTTEHGYSVQTDPETVDAYRFEMGVREGRRLVEAGAHRRAEAVLRAALEEWRGEPYTDAQMARGIHSEIARLEALKRAAEVDLAAAAMELAGSAPDTTALEMLVQSDPFDERRWGLLMKALYRSGRPAEALAAFQRAAAVLGDQLGIVPGPGLQELEEQILLHDARLQPADSHRTLSLPGFATSMLGRSEQASMLAKRLAEHRLVTVTGLGGVGKTRLAVAAAHEAVADFADGAVFVPLDSVSEGGLVTDSVATRIGLFPTAAPIEALVGHLAARKMVLVLDNCEHVLGDVASLVSRLLTSCPGIALLCTSRIPLDVGAETLFSVGPLRVPAPHLEFNTPEELLLYESISLFCDRATAARPEFGLDAENGPVVAEIVRRLAGIPLSIEIAAAKCDVLNPIDILDRLEATPHGLASGDRDRAERHQSMANAVRWSLDLLDEPARELFRRMAVFVSPVNAETIEAVCGDNALESGAIHAALAALARSSLISVDFDETRARYSQLPPLRAVAAELLASNDDRMRRRHVEHFAAVAASEVGFAGGADEEASFDRLTGVLDELRAALRHAAESDHDTGRRMCIDLGTFWIRTGRTAEGRTWVDRFLQSGSVEPLVSAALLHLTGSLALVEQDLDAAERALTAALELRRDLDVPRELGMTLSNLGGLANSRGDYDQAEDLFREALDVFGAVGYDRGAGAARLNLGLALLNLGSIEAAAEQLERAVYGFRRVGDRSEEAHALLRLGFAHAELGDRIRAEACRLAAHEIYEEMGRLPDVAYSHSNLAAHYLEAGAFDRARAHATASAKLVLSEDLRRWWVPELIETAAGISAAVGTPDQGARLLGCASAHRRAHNVPSPEAVRAFLESTQRQLEHAVGAEQYVIETEIGGTRSLMEGIRAVAAWA